MNEVLFQVDHTQLPLNTTVAKLRGKNSIESSKDSSFNCLFGK